MKSVEGIFGTILMDFSIVGLTFNKAAWTQIWKGDGRKQIQFLLGLDF